MARDFGAFTLTVPNDLDALPDVVRLIEEKLRVTGLLDATGPAERLLCALVASTLTTSHALAPDGREVDWKLVRPAGGQAPRLSLNWTARLSLPVGAPIRIIRSVAASNARNGLRSLNAASLLVRLLQALSGGGVSAIPLKEISLAARAYGDVAGRRCGDIDLLIPAGDLPAADAILRETGWRRVSNTTREQVGEDYAEDPNRWPIISATRKAARRWSFTSLCIPIRS